MINKVWKSIQLVAMDYNWWREGEALQMADGTIFMITPGPEHCFVEEGQTVAEWGGGTCYGWIDVNGLAGPNKEVSCSDTNTTAFLWDKNYKDCIVKNNANNMSDIYPIVYHDEIVEPATNAARAVLLDKK